jgi:hypothetical protein
MLGVMGEDVTLEQVEDGVEVQPPDLSPAFDRRFGRGRS